MLIMVLIVSDREPGVPAFEILTEFAIQRGVVRVCSKESPLQDSLANGFETLDERLILITIQGKIPGVCRQISA